MREEEFTTVDRRGLADHAVDQIERLIIEGRLVPGQKLPSERDLGVKLGVSRPTLREAIRALTMMGILESRQGDGTYVLDAEADFLLRPAKVLLASEGGLGWLFEVRGLLEGGAASFAAARATTSELDEVNEWLAGYPAGEVDPNAIRVRDLRLHSLIITATHNPLLSAIVASLSSALSESRVLTGQEPDWEVLGMIDLKAVAEAIVRRDPPAAQLAMIRHLENGQQRYQRRVANPGPDRPENGG
jgi:GntR family transcriptional regulator, transcriptional repressor for pyruvate dehydrogenase complex